MTRDVLICAGLDPSGGAGLLADAAVVRALGGRPCGVVTVQTVQATTGVTGTSPVDPELVEEQLAALLGDLEIRAVKIGMLGGAEIARAIVRTLDATTAPVVWDPVLAPSRGAVTAVGEWIVEATRLLGPQVTLITPNLAELAVLGGDRDPLDAAKRLAAGLGTSVLVKGGHAGGARSIDHLVAADGTVEALDGPRLPGGHDVHGTGCALSSAIATRLAHGDALLDACRAAKAFVAERIAHAVSPGRGARAII